MYRNVADRCGSSIAVCVFAITLGFCTQNILAVDAAADKAAYLKVREKCAKRMEPVLKLREKLKKLSGAQLEKFGDPRFAPRLGAWEKASAEFAAKLSSGAAAKEDLQKYQQAFDQA